MPAAPRVRLGAGSASARKGDVSATDCCSARVRTVTRLSIGAPVEKEASLFLDERDLVPVRIGDREGVRAPRCGVGLEIEPATLRLDARRERIDVLRRRGPEPEALALLAVPPLGEVVLGKH